MVGDAAGRNGDRPPDSDNKEFREDRRYVLRYRAGLEVATMRALAFLGIEYVRLTFQHRLPRSRGIVTRPWFPGYAFVTFDVKRDPWTHVLRAPGVTAILGNPTPMDETVFRDVVQRCPAGLMAQDALTVIPAGSVVEVIDGPFRGYTGVVATSHRDVVTVELMTFTRPTRVEMRTYLVRVL